VTPKQRRERASKGGKTRVANMTAEQLSKANSEAATLRWARLSPEERSAEWTEKRRKAVGRKMKAWWANQRQAETARGKM
jgi:hypothetical protein